MVLRLVSYIFIFYIKIIKNIKYLYKYRKHYINISIGYIKRQQRVQFKHCIQLYFKRLLNVYRR
ncbi:hypothetical protein N491_12355 [Clostridium botulinum B2 275]|nr:hypothetical protein N491_12355 [Clostridium botulinum B2 275]